MPATQNKEGKNSLNTKPSRSKNLRGLMRHKLVRWGREREREQSLHGKLDRQRSYKEARGETK